MKAIDVKKGDRVRYLGNEIVRDDGKERLAFGDIGEVIEVLPPREGLGEIEDIDGEMVADPDRNGYARVRWPHFRVTLILVEGEGVRWKRLPHLGHAD